MCATHLPAQGCSFPTSDFKVVDASEAIEEETLPGYTPEKYYPAQLGEILNHYQILGKLGFGTTSTVWLARDYESRYVALKSFLSVSNRDHEVKVYKHFDSIETDHPGNSKLLGSFQVKGPHGNHLCLVHEPLGPSLHQVLDFYPKRKFPLGVLKPSLRQILAAVDLLHSTKQVHTKAKTKNLLVGTSDPSAFSIFEDAEFSQPAPRKMLADRTIYATRRCLQQMDCPSSVTLEKPGFLMRPGEDIMPNVYKAPEVILQMSWDCKVDIWNVAMVSCAEITALMGPPPTEFIRRPEMCRAVWNEDGSWKGVVPLPDITLEKLAENVTGEDKDGFLQLFRRMLHWLPEERPTGEELIFDSWLIKGLGEN
ncbi:CMGC/SRPK protein kinase [Polytolypa hystricis UAMH7299]|uniref:non-specific serine/threonine protein kinase n=1 Tax=Polytolypa hystricis (strain UAMH7299) TaxID=1447883 RepID=A0A2B7WH99_POLH7|nr:CMGC/SRPK protein kinase [Polytolypa hystricis UAMH7299]